MGDLTAAFAHALAQEQWTRQGHDGAAPDWWADTHRLAVPSLLARDDLTLPDEDTLSAQDRTTLVEHLQRFAVHRYPPGSYDTYLTVVAGLRAALDRVNHTQPRHTAPGRTPPVPTYRTRFTIPVTIDVELEAGTAPSAQVTAITAAEEYVAAHLGGIDVSIGRAQVTPYATDRELLAVDTTQVEAGRVLHRRTGSVGPDWAQR